MKFQFLLALIASSVFAQPCSAEWDADAKATTWVQCAVIDGDTLYCSGKRVRLRGLFAPERGTEGADNATRRLSELLGSGHIFLVERAFDRYGRAIADLYIDGRRIRQADIGPLGGEGVDRRPSYKRRLKMLREEQ